MMRTAIVSIGDELILGQTVDTNAAWLSEQLATIGLAAAEHVTIGDDLDVTADQLNRLSREMDLVIVTGGLGPTEDDLTRQGLAKVLNTTLELDTASLARIEALFAARQRPMPSRNAIQAMIPLNGRALPNDIGTAPGIAATVNRAAVYCLPGVPEEMREMFQKRVQPEIETRLGGQGRRQIIVTRLLHTLGIGESGLAEQISDLMSRGTNPQVNCTAKDGQVSLRINATAKDAASAELLIEPIEHELRHRLGELIYGEDDDTIASVVGRLLRTRNATIATAESCTGGLLAKCLIDIPGSSDYVRCGWVTYSNATKIEQLNVDPETIRKYGAVSEPVARQLANNARLKAGTDYAISTTGIAGPAGGSADKPVGLVYIGLADNSGTSVERYVFPGDRCGVRLRAAVFALNMLRLRLMKT